MTSPKITIITVGRKPLSEQNVAQNVIKWETGGINVGASRVGNEERFNPPTSAKSANSLKRTMGGGWREDYQGKARKGRWPANVILSHQPGCCGVGTRRVKTGTAGKSSRGWGSGGEQTFNEHKSYGTETYGDADGMETTPAWICVPGCPVAEVERQGIAIGSHSAGDVSSKLQVSDYTASSYKFSNADQPREMFRYGDEGGVSRFFKQIREGEE